MTNILLAGHSGSYNRGCEAIIRCSIDILKRYVPEPTYGLISYFPDTDRAHMGSFLAKHSVELSHDAPPFLERFTRAWFVDGIKRRFTRGFPTRPAFLNRDMYGKADVVVRVGGDMFTDDVHQPRGQFRDLAYARALGAKTVVWAASIGPFQQTRMVPKYVEAFKKTDLITVREPVTERYLARLGVRDNVRRTADPAFLLEPEPTDLIKLPDTAPGKCIGIGLSALCNKKGRGESVIEEFTLFARHLLQDAETQVVLVAHVTGAASYLGDDDRVCQILREQLPPNVRPRVFIVPTELNAPQMKHVIGQLDYFLGCRTHSTIASLSQCIPTLSIAYSSKALGINEALFGHTDYVVSLDQLTCRMLEKAFDSLRENRPLIQRQLGPAVKEARSLALEGGRFLANLL